MTPRIKKNVTSLEDQLAGVLERDGVTMISAEGVRRKAKRSRRSTAPKPTSPSIFFESSPPPRDHADDVSDLDVASVGLLVKSSEGARERTIAIHYCEHKRSAFVLSLRDFFFSAFSRPADERMPMQAAFESADCSMARPATAAVYGTLTSDLSLDGYDPHALAGQFTPHDFYAAYRQAYGRMDRLTVFFGDLARDVASLFQRVERVERRVAAEVRDTLTVVEVPRLSLARSLAGFVLLLLIVTLPANAVILYRQAAAARDAVEGASQEALRELEAAKSSPSLPTSAASLRRASVHFREADTILTESKTLALGIASVLPQRYRTARALLEAGDKASEAGRLLTVGFDKMFHDPSRSMDERLEVLSAYAQGALPLLSDAAQAAASVAPENLPEDKRESFRALSSHLNAALIAVREFSSIAQALSRLAGKESQRRYLFIFQNNSELRPTGGFMGSVAEVTLNRGAINRIYVPPGGTYDLKGQLLAHVISPAPLHLINPHWQFQDANWFPDFPASAQKIRWFWSKAGQPTVDGVIAVNASFVEKFLEITGPIDMPTYSKVIDRNNFMLETQKAVEMEYDKAANTPKKFIGDLLQAMMEMTRTFTKDDWLKAAALVSDGLQTKDIQASFSKPEEEEMARRYGWSGQLKAVNGDSLAIVEANIAGQKTDGAIEETVKLVAEIQSDGSIIDHVTLTRTHRGSKGELFRGVRNVSYIRAYVPEGSQLISASGLEAPPSKLFKKPDEDYQPDASLAAMETAARKGAGGVEIMNEGERTVFGGWAQLDPGMTQTITYRYRLPFTIKDIYARLEASPEDQTARRAAYLLLLTSQSGKTSRKIEAKVNVPAAWDIAWTRGTTQDGASDLSYSGVWDRDRALAALLEE